MNIFGVVVFYSVAVLAPPQEVRSIFKSFLSIMMILFTVLTIYVTVVVADVKPEIEGVVDMSCLKCYDDLWPIKPVGDSQLADILAKATFDTLTPHYPSREELFQVLYHSSKSPYDGMEITETIGSDQYVSTAQFLSSFLQEKVLEHFGGNPPRVFLEVGCFIGSGAIHAWAPLVQAFGPEGIVICVDTWQGDLNMKLGEQFQEWMAVERGHPQIFSKFMNRMVYYDLTDVIYPLPMPSLTAARLLFVANWKIDCIYLDSAHEIGETFAELVLYYQLLRPGGLLMGDDYDAFPAVKHDLDLFVKLYGKKYGFNGTKYNNGQWFIAKPE